MGRALIDDEARPLSWQRMEYMFGGCDAVKRGGLIEAPGVEGWLNTRHVSRNRACLSKEPGTKRNGESY